VNHLILQSNPRGILAVCFDIAIRGFWIPAIPAGMTYFKVFVYNDERFGVGAIKSK
jgi:hypothetical protein